jgi:hypothetical protein
LIGLPLGRRHGGGARRRALAGVSVRDMRLASRMGNIRDSVVAMPREGTRNVVAGLLHCNMKILAVQ